MPRPNQPEWKSDALVAARRFAAALVAEGEDLSPSERMVISRALLHQLQLAFRELGLVEPAEPAVRPPVAVRGRSDVDVDVEVEVEADADR